MYHLSTVTERYQNIQCIHHDDTELIIEALLLPEEASLISLAVGCKMVPILEHKTPSQSHDRPTRDR